MVLKSTTSRSILGVAKAKKRRNCVYGAILHVYIMSTCKSTRIIVLDKKLQKQCIALCSLQLKKLFL
jgi:hypothetical protein